MGDDEEWRFSLDDLDDEDDTERDHSADGTDPAVSESDVADEDRHLIAGKVDVDEEIEPEPISLENTFFVVLGAALTVLVFVAFALGI